MICPVCGKVINAWGGYYGFYPEVDEVICNRCYHWVYDIKNRKGA